MTEIQNDRFDILTSYNNTRNSVIFTLKYICIWRYTLFRRLTKSLPFSEADAFKDRILSQDDVLDVVCEILYMREKSDRFGRVLKLPKAIVDSIYLQYSDPQDRLFHIIDKFVRQVEPPPTWRVILEALRNPLIGEHRLASKIERKHCPLTLQQDGMYLLLPKSLHKLQGSLKPLPHLLEWLIG